MADDLSFTISAEDQASKVVDTVKNKINSFGTDIAKMALGIAGPMALISAGLGFVMEKIQQYKQEKLDAQREAAMAEENIQKAATEKELEQIKIRKEEYKKAEAEKTAALKREEENRKKKLSLYEEIKALQIDLQLGGPSTGVDLLKELSNKVKDTQREFLYADRQRKQFGRGTDVDVLEKQKAFLEAQKAFRDEEKKQDTANKQAREKGAGAGADKVKPEEVKPIKDAVKVTVSSLREIGGSFGGGDINTGIERQVELAQKQIDVLTTIANNTTPKSDIGEPLNMGDTKFTEFGGYEGFLDAITAYQRK